MKIVGTLSLITVILSLIPTQSILAGDKTKSATLDCARGSLASEIDKLDRSVANVLEFTGDCVEDIVIEGHRNLTLRGVNGASVTATVFDPADENGSTTALMISRSDVTVESVTINGGRQGVQCDNRSVCILRDVDILRGFGGLAAQSQSAVDVYGSSEISGTGSGFAGIGVYGASAVNIRPHWVDGYVEGEPGYRVSGFLVGVVAQDGSFFRSDNLEVTGNAWKGMWIRRGTTAKIYSDDSLPGVQSNGWRGVEVTLNSTAHLITPISGHAEDFALGELSSAQVQDALIDGAILCYDDTARSNVCQ